MTLRAAGGLKSERIRVQEAAAILGVPARTVQAKAALGELPSAALIFGRWTFEEAALRKYVWERSDATCQKAKRLKDVTGGAMRSGAASRSPAKRPDGAFERGMAILQRHATSKKRRA